MSPLTIASLVLTAVGTANNIWASIRMIYEIKPTNFGFLNKLDVTDKDKQDIIHKKQTVSMTIIGTTILLLATVFSSFA